MKNTIQRIIGRFGIKVSRVSKNDYRNNLNKLNNINGKTFKYQVLNSTGDSVFFGYHDKIPFSSDQSKILSNLVRGASTDVTKECSKMELGYFKRNGDVFENKFIKIGETYLWSWQQGCMLQWNPKSPNNQIYYNTLVDNKHGSVLYDINKGKIVDEYDSPIYAISPTGNIAASINFKRLADLRPGYGYCKFSDSNNNQRTPCDDGIHLMNLDTNEKKLIVNLEQLSNYKNTNAPHYINHVTFSPSGRYLTFFHILDDFHNKRNIQFYLYDIETGSMELLEAGKTVSHYCWKNDHEIFTSEINHGPTDYYIYNIKEKSKRRVEILKIGDVHPMFSPTNQDLILIDTKPDDYRYQHLLVYNLQKKDYDYLGRFHLPNSFKDEVRCDLHPRWNFQGTQVSVDTVTDGLRSMTIIDYQY